MSSKAHDLYMRRDSASRLEDYLNDKLQTFADFDTLDSLVANVEAQQKLLRAQLEDAENALQSTAERSSREDVSIRSQFQAYEDEASDIDRRLRIITQSETSDDAVRRFNESMKKLNRLEIASGYFALIANVDRLSTESISTLKSNPEQALESYVTLYDLKLKLKILQDDADGAAPHLLDHVEHTTYHVRQTIKEYFATELNKVLERILWPRPDVKIPDSLREQWIAACDNLLALQKPELLHNDVASESHNRVESSNALLPLEVMVRPLELRFQYHFNGDKPTNRLDKPEYFLSHILDLLDTYMPFILDVFQPILLHFTSRTDLAFKSSYIDAPSAFIEALLPMIRKKINLLIPQLLSQPNLLSHLIHELMDFDNKLRDEWRFAGNETSVRIWKGLTGEVISQNDWFDRWLQVEKDFALARYDAIVNDNDSSGIDYDAVDSKATKPTKAAIRVNDLLETVTELYRPLSSFSPKLRFLIEVQISIFDLFHSRLSSGLEAFLSMSSSFGRTMKGVSDSDVASVQGVKGLDRLCRIFGSADYLEKSMRDWSDDSFFLDLWDELQQRVKMNSMVLKGNLDQPRESPLVAGSLSISDIATRTSSKLTETSDKEASYGEFASGALFDETAVAYSRLRSHSEQLLVDTLTSTLRESLRPYGRTNPWSSLSSPSAVTSSQPDGSAEDTLIASVDLNPVLKELSSNLMFLAKTVGNAPLQRIVRKTVRNLDGYVFDRVILGNTFSLQGAKQFAVDIETLSFLIDKIVEGDQGSRGFSRCMEARILLNLPLLDDSTAKVGDETKPSLDRKILNPQNGQQLRIWEAESRIFESNHSARLLLDDLGLETLTENDARQILRRRVELNR